MGKKFVRIGLFLSLLFVFSSPMIVVAAKTTENEETTTEAKNQGSEEAKQDLSKWWTKNPLSFDPMPTKLLKHFELTYSWDRSTGNWTSDNHMLNATLSLRLNRFTNHLRYTFDKRSVAKPQDPPNSDKNKDLRTSTKHEIHEDFRVALTDRIYLAPGMFYLEDDYSYIDERFTYYLGIGAEAIKHPLFKLSLFGAYGYETLKYIDDYHTTYLLIQEWGIADQIEGYDPGTEESDILYFNEVARAYVWPNPAVMLTQELLYVRDVSDSDIYRWTFKVGLDIQVMEHLFMSINYQEDYDNDANQLLGLRKRDQTTGVGVKIVF